MHSFNPIIINSKSLNFVVEGKKRKILIDQQDFHQVSNILKEVPELKSEKINLAKVIDFLYQGFENELITDPDAFKKMYSNLIEKEKNIAPFSGVPKSSSWGIYDLSESTTPYWKENQLHFNVWNMLFRFLITLFLLSIPNNVSTTYLLLISYN